MYYLTAIYQQDVDVSQETDWTPAWTQTVEGCPVEYSISATDNETDEPIDIEGLEDTPVLSFVSTETIATDVPWSEQSGTFELFEAVVQVQIPADQDSYDL